MLTCSRLFVVLFVPLTFGCGTKPTLQPTTTPTVTPAPIVTPPVTSRGPERIAAPPELLRLSPGDRAVRGDLRIGVERAEVVEEGLTLQLMVIVRLENTHAGQRRYWQPWLYNSTLTDDLGNSYRHYRVNGRSDQEQAVDPEGRRTDLLTFELPVRPAKMLYLSLGGGNVGADTDIEFAIPTANLGDAFKPK